MQVAPPWYITPTANLAPIACGNMGTGFLFSCIDVIGATYSVWTADPNPPARNIVIRYGASCPEP